MKYSYLYALVVFCLLSPISNFATSTNGDLDKSLNVGVSGTPSNYDQFLPSKLLDHEISGPRAAYGRSKGNLGTGLLVRVDSGFAVNLEEGNAAVYALAVQPDGKILIGGTFNEIGGIARGNLERFNPDGSPDSTFNPGGLGANAQVYTIDVLPDGKILIGGFFTAYNGQNAQKIARLNADGTLDLSFNVQGTSVNSGIQDLVIQPDGKLLIAGNFTNFDGTQRNRVARLNADGTLDTTFNPNVNGFVEELVLQPDGKIFIGGIFSTVGGVGRNSIARLNADGSLDLSFDVGSGVLIDPTTLGSVFAAELQADGKILIGGYFPLVNGFSRQNVARLNSNGSVDTGFAPGTLGYGVEHFAILPDGKIIVVGHFDPNNAGIVRLDSSGTIDTSFQAGEVDDFGYVVRIADDGKVLLGGLFSQYGNLRRTAIARLNSDGSVDAMAPEVIADPIVWALEQQADGKLLVGGSFRKANGDARRNLARFHLDGTLDTTFDPGNSLGGFNRPYVFSLREQGDGRILAGGNFSVASGSARDWIMRLNADGTLDPGFSVPHGVTPVRDIEEQTDGKILLAGFFMDPILQTTSGIVRVNPDGTFDNGFMGSGANGTVTEIVLLPGGKALFGGTFTHYSGTPRNRIARINPDGTLDTTFSPGSGANSTVNDIELLENGQILVGGAFSSFDGLANTNDVVRLNANGSVDTSFSTGSSGFLGNVLSIVAQADGNIMIGGNFSDYNGVAVNRLARVSSNGELDSSFTSPLDDSANNVFRLHLQADDEVLVGGTFTVPRKGVFRLGSGTTAPFDFDGDGKTDVSIFRPAGGEWWYGTSSNGGHGAAVFGTGGDVIAPADYTGDGKTDMAFFRPSTGEWFFLRSEDFSFYSFPFGGNGDIPAPADYDGDGKADAAVYRPSTGTWYVFRSSDSQVSITGFGVAGDQPIPADYDGDGMADIGIFRPNGTNGAEWWILRSTDGLLAVQFGGSDAKVVPGDYTGDGKADVAFFNSTGAWYILRSEDLSFYSFPFGVGSDTPVPGDYDGDGRMDAAVFRNSSATWFMQGSTSGTMITGFGVPGDRPVPNAFVR